MTDEQRAERGPDMFVPRAPAPVQQIFDTMLTALAHRQGFKDAAMYIKNELGGVVHTHTFTHIHTHTWHTHTHTPTH